MFKVEVGEVLAVEQIRRKLLQAAAGQIYRVDPLGHHLDGGGVIRGGKWEEWRSKKRETETWS